MSTVTFTNGAPELAVHLATQPVGTVVDFEVLGHKVLVEIIAVERPQSKENKTNEE